MAVGGRSAARVGASPAARATAVIEDVAAAAEIRAEASEVVAAAVKTVATSADGCRSVRHAGCTGSWPWATNLYLP